MTSLDKKTRKSATNFQNWKISQRYIRIEHNKAVNSWFRGDNNPTRINLRNSILVYKKDSANQLLAKMQFFNNYMNTKSAQVINAYPEDYQLRAEVDRPQLLIIFKPTRKDISNQQYVTTIPHYSGDRTPNIQPYYKGNHWARIKLKDNSHIRVNARTKSEATSTIRKYIQLVDIKYKPSEDTLTTGEYASNPFIEARLVPYRADYYSRGKKGAYPDWQYNFN